MKRPCSFLCAIFITMIGLPRCAPADEAARTQPVSRLPDGIGKGEEGKFSLYADFRAGAGKRPALYLINRTDKQITLRRENTEVYIMQEAKIDGKWVRSEPHTYDWCGNAYEDPPSIPPGCFATERSLFLIRDWMPPEKTTPADADTEREVRYRFYTRVHHDVISNTGRLPVSARLIETANGDEMAIRFADVRKLAGFATGGIKVASLNRRLDLRLEAIYDLMDHKDDPLARNTLRDLAEAGSGPPSRAAIGTLRHVFSADEAFGLLLALVQNGKCPDRDLALTKLADLEGKEAALQEVCRGITADYSHPLYLTALRLEISGQPEAAQRARAQQVTDDPNAPETIKKGIREMLEYSFPFGAAAPP